LTNLDVGAADGSFDFAQDFASRFGRLLSCSSSNPSGPAKLIAVIADIARDRRHRESEQENSDPVIERPRKISAVQ
jgi:hypothetical protein